MGPIAAVKASGFQAPQEASSNDSEIDKSIGAILLTS